MPLYEYQCARGHRFERQVPLAQFDYAQPCPQCGLPGEQILTRAPGTVGVFSDRGVALAEERVYREHNVTRHIEGEAVTADPNPPSLQCTCGDCGSHRRRAGITATAEPGKDR